MEFIHQHREKLVLKPNDDYSEQQSFAGSEMDQQAWERAVRAGAALTLRGAGEGRAGSLDLPDDDLRPSGVPGDAGGRPPAGVSRQGVGLRELAVCRRRRLFLFGRHGADLHHRSEVEARHASPIIPVGFEIAGALRSSRHSRLRAGWLRLRSGGRRSPKTQWRLPPSRARHRWDRARPQLTCTPEGTTRIGN